MRIYQGLFEIFIIMLMFSFSKSSIFYKCNFLISDNYDLLDMKSPLCDSLLNASETILVRIVDDVSYIGQDFEGLYDSDSDKYFSSKCANTGKRSCRTTSLISIYFKPRKIRIVMGTEVANVINHYSRLSIINEMGTYLSKNDYTGAVIYAVNKIKSKLPSVHQEEHFSEKDHSSARIFIVVIVLVLLFSCCCLYMCWKREKQEEINLQNNEYSTHLHFIKLMDLIKFKIKPSTPPIIGVQQCLICMDFLNPNWEHDEINKTTNSNLFLCRFECGHYYHISCLKELNFCYLCDSLQSQVVVEPYFTYNNVISEDQVFNLIKNFDKIYKKEVLQSYQKSYKNDVSLLSQSNNNTHTFVWIEPIYLNPYGGGYGGYGGYSSYNQYNYYGGNNYNPPIYNETNNLDNNSNYITSTTGGDYGGQEMKLIPDNNTELNTNSIGNDHDQDHDLDGGDY